MSPLFFAFLASLSIVSVSLTGAITLNRFAREKMERTLPYLVSASAGIFIVVVATLILEALAFLSLAATAGLVALGFLLLLIVSWILPESHHHHIDEECDTAGAKKPHAQRILIADGIHNIGDGIILVPAFLVSPALGMSVTFGILVHEAIQGLSEFFVLRAAGLSTKRALLYNLLTACTIFFGIAIGATLATFETITAGLLAVSAGAFLFVVFKDLIPHSFAHSKAHRKAILHIISALAGILLMGAISLATPDEHTSDDAYHESDI